MARQRNRSIPIGAVRAACLRIDAAVAAGATRAETERLADTEYSKLITEKICVSCRKPFDAYGFVGFETSEGIVPIHNTKTCLDRWENEQTEVIRGDI